MSIPFTLMNFPSEHQALTAQIEEAPLQGRTARKGNATPRAQASSADGYTAINYRL